MSRIVNAPPRLMRGATAGAAGQSGYVRAPAAGDQNKFARGDGSWANPGTGSYLGGVAGASVPATASAAGDWYLITSAGTSQGKTWAVGDKASYEGISGNWTQISAQSLFAYNAPTAISAAGNTNLALGTGQAQRVEKIAVSAGSSAYTHTLTLQNTNAVAGYEIDGQVSVAASTNPLVEIRNLTSAGTLLGAITGDSVARVWNFRARFDGTNWFITSFAKHRGASIDELNASVNPRATAQGLVFDGMASATVSGIPAFGTGDFTVAVWVGFTSAADNTELVSGTATNAASLQAMANGRLRLVQSSVAQRYLTTAQFLTVGKVTMVYWSRSGSTNTVGTPGSVETFTDSSDFSAALDKIGSANFVGSIRAIAFNRALTAAEVLALYERGAPDAADFNNASNTALTTSFVNYQFGSFTQSATGWSGVLNTAIGAASTAKPDINAVKGTRYRVAFTLAGPGNINVTFGGAYVVGASPGANVHEVTVVTSGVGGIQFYFNPGEGVNGGTYTVTNFSITPLGLLLAPDATQAGIGNKWADTSGKNAHITLPASGVSWALPSSGLPLATTLGGMNGPNLVSTLAARGPSQGIVFDGTGEATFSVPAVRTNPTTLVAWVSNDTATNGLRWITSNTSQTQMFLSGGYAGQLYTPGGSVYTPVLTQGKRHMVAFVLNGAGSATPYLDGAAGTAGTITADLTDPFARIGGISANYHVGYLRPLIYNRALTAAEVLALYERGAPDAADFNNASNTALNTSNFVNGWPGDGVSRFYTTFSGASASGFTAAEASGDNIAAAQPNLSIVAGRKYRATFSATLTSGQAPTLVLLSNAGITDRSNKHTVTAGANSVEFTVNATDSSVSAAFQTSAATSYAISGFSLVPIGLLLAPEAAAPGNGYQWKDMSGNKADITLPVSGVSWALPDRRPNSVRGTLSWAGAKDSKNLLLSERPALPSGAVVSRVSFKASAATTGTGLQIGSGDDGNYFRLQAAATTSKTSAAPYVANGVTVDTLSGRAVWVVPDTNNYTGIISIEVNYENINEL
jgi:hypothetical protein